MEETEPLALLRKYASEKRPIGDDGPRLVFGNLCCEKTALTNFKWSVNNEAEEEETNEGAWQTSMVGYTGICSSS